MQHFRLRHLPRPLPVTAFAAGLSLVVGAGALRAQGAPPSGRAQVSGPVIDSITGSPLAGAVVQFVNAQNPNQMRSATADSMGRYRIDSLVPGVYLVGVLHARADQLGVGEKVTPVRIADTGRVELGLGTPSLDALLGRYCGGAPGLFLGRVRHADDRPLAGPGRVRVQYVDVTVSSTGVQRRTPARFADVNPDGSFVVCGLPAGATITTRAYAGADSSGSVDLPLPEAGLLVRDIYVAPIVRRPLAAATGARGARVVTGTARIRGTVRDTLGRPLTNARVVVPGNDVEAATAAGGAYTLDQLPAGTWSVEARAVGYQPMRLVLDLKSGEDAVADMRLAVVPAVVDTVRVRADLSARNLNGFEERKKAGMGGYFMDEAKITARRAQWMSDLLRGTPGITIQPRNNGRDEVRMRGLGGNGDCWPTVYFNGVEAPVDRGVIDDIVRPDDVKGVEIYPGTATMPMQYRGRTGCGSIVIWTGPRKR